MDSYVEQLVAHKQNIKDFLVKVVMILSIFAVLALGLVFGALVNSYFVAVGVFLATFDIYFCWYVITGRDVEYEYIVTHNNLQIDKVMAKRRRKSVLSVDIKTIECFDKITNNTLNPDRCDKVMYLGTYDDDPQQYNFIVTTTRYGKVFVVFAPNEKILNAMKQHLKPEIKVQLFKNQNNR